MILYVPYILAALYFTSVSVCVISNVSARFLVKKKTKTKKILYYTVIYIQPASELIESIDQLYTKIDIINVSV